MQIVVQVVGKRGWMVNGRLNQSQTQRAFVPTGLALGDTISTEDTGVIRSRGQLQCLRSHASAVQVFLPLPPPIIFLHLIKT